MNKMKDCNETADCSGRREFLVKAAFMAGGLVLTLSGAKAGFGNTVGDLTINIGPDSPLAKVGGSDVVNSAAGKIIILRTGEASFVAYSARCTHKGTTVEYDAASKQFVCPSHGSRFETNSGAVARGPAKEPLASYKAEGDAKSVTVTVS